MKRNNYKRFCGAGMSLCLAMSMVCANLPAVMMTGDGQRIIFAEESQEAWTLVFPEVSTPRFIENTNIQFTLTKEGKLQLLSDESDIYYAALYSTPFKLEDIKNKKSLSEEIDLVDLIKNNKRSIYIVKIKSQNVPAENPSTFESTTKTKSEPDETSANPTENQSEPAETQPVVENEIPTETPESVTENTNESKNAITPENIQETSTENNKTDEAAKTNIANENPAVGTESADTNTIPEDSAIESARATVSSNLVALKAALPDEDKGFEDVAKIQLMTTTGNPEITDLKKGITISVNEKYIASFDAGEGKFSDGSSKLTIDINQNAEVDKVKKPTPPEGKEFVNWFDSDGNRAYYIDSVYIKAGETYYARYRDLNDLDRSYENALKAWEDAKKSNAPEEEIKRLEYIKDAEYEKKDLQDSSLDGAIDNVTIAKKGQENARKVLADMQKAVENNPTEQNKLNLKIAKKVLQISQKSVDYANKALEIQKIYVNSLMKQADLLRDKKIAELEGSDKLTDVEKKYNDLVEKNQDVGSVVVEAEIVAGEIRDMCGSGFSPKKISSQVELENAIRLVKADMYVTDTYKDQLVKYVNGEKFDYKIEDMEEIATEARKAANNLSNSNYTEKFIELAKKIGYVETNDTDLDKDEETVQGKDEHKDDKDKENTGTTENNGGKDKENAGTTGNNGEKDKENTGTAGNNGGKDNKNTETTGNKEDKGNSANIVKTYYGGGGGSRRSERREKYKRDESLLSNRADEKKAPDTNEMKNNTEQVEKPEVQKVEKNREVRFSDVKTTTKNYAAIKEVREKKLMVGTSRQKFAPNEKFTKAMMATVLYRLSGSPAVVKKVNFSDVNVKKWYAKPAFWAAKKDIFEVEEKNKFNPNEKLSRADVAEILYKYVSKKPGKVSEKEAVNWAVKNKIFAKGTNSKQEVTRAEMAQILINLQNLLDK